MCLLGVSLSTSSLAHFSITADGELYPGLSEEEIKSKLDNIPVYAPIDQNNREKAALDPDGSGRCSWFVSKKMAERSYDQLSTGEDENEDEDNSAGGGKTMMYSLHSLLDNWEEFYHLVPDHSEEFTRDARLAYEAAGSPEFPVWWIEGFQTAVEESSEESSYKITKTYHPIYFAWRDLLQDYVKFGTIGGGGGAFKPPKMTAMDFHDVLKVLKDEHKHFDLRKSVFIPLIAVEA